MKFSINVEKFMKSLVPVEIIANKKENEGYESAGRITFDVSKDKIVAKAHGGTAAISAVISNDNIPNLNYECKEDGVITIMAEQFMKTLSSFPPSGDITIYMDGQEITASLNVDEDVDEQIQTVFSESGEIKLPNLSSKFKKQATINREIFVDGMDKVQFAMGFEKTVAHYMCQLFEIEKGKARFAAGSGARFAIADIESKNILGANSKQTFIFPKANVSPIISILKNTTSTNITIKESPANVDNSNNPAQIVIDFDEGISLIVLAIDTAIKYPDLNKILEFDYPYKVSSDISQWKYVVVGIEATNTKDIKKEHEMHNANVVAMLDKKVLFMETKSPTKAKRQIKDMKILQQGKTKEPSFCCNSAYILEAYGKGGNSGDVILEFETKEESDDGRVKPVVVRFPEIVNSSKDTLEKFTIFFATSNR